MAVEAAGGWLSGSLALLADAGHMLTDFAALGLAWAAVRVRARPSDWTWTFGFDRFSVLAAFVNGLALVVIAALILWEAASRLAEPSPVMGWPMLAVALAGLAVNIAVWRILRGQHAQGHAHGHDHGSGAQTLNIRAASLHVMGDLLGSVGAIAAAGIILATGWTPADPILSVAVALLILNGARRIVAESARILLEAAPAGLDLAAVAADLARLDGVASVHHLHAWSISEERPMITLHARLAPGADPDRTRHALRGRLARAHGIAHATIEIEAPSPDRTPPGTSPRTSPGTSPPGERC